MRARSLFQPLHVCARAADSHLSARAGDSGEVELEEDDELNLGDTDADVEADEQEEPQMMSHASYWDHFLALVRSTQEPWAAPADDTDEYREKRAVDAFNKGGSLPLPRFAPLVPCLVIARVGQSLIACCLCTS